MRFACFFFCFSFFFFFFLFTSSSFASKVVHKPVSAIKEMLENSLDAHSSSIRITLREGGTKTIQICDDGDGIDCADFPNVCAAHSTSKLRTFEDLKHISTFGFRGEALASISRVSHVKITSATATSKCAFSVKFEDSKMIGKPAPCAGNKGTTIVAEDLFYNVPVRRKTLRYPRKEFHSISDVVRKYAVHYPAVSFMLKEAEDSGPSVTTQPNSSSEENIGAIYSPVARENLLPIVLDLAQEYQVSIKGMLTNGKFSNGKSTIWILFINGRLVENRELQLAIDRAYAKGLPHDTEKRHPLVYLSFTVDPQNVDVNVDPNKKIVNFLHEEAVADALQKRIRETLKAWYDASKKDEKAKTQQAAVQSNLNVTKRLIFGSESSSSSSSLSRANKKSKKQKKAHNSPAPPPPPLVASPPLHNLDCVAEIQRAIVENYSEHLSAVLKQHKFVGVVDPQHSIITHDKEMYLINHHTVTMSVSYQYVLRNIGQFASTVILPNVLLSDLIQAALQSSSSGYDPAQDGPIESVRDSFADFLMDKRKVLSESFSIVISDSGHLQRIPISPLGVVPPLAQLPNMLLSIAYDVPWDTVPKDALISAQVVDRICAVLADWFSIGPCHFAPQPVPLPALSSPSSAATDVLLRSSSLTVCAHRAARSPMSYVWARHRLHTSPSYFVASFQCVQNALSGIPEDERFYAAVCLGGRPIKFAATLSLGSIAGISERIQHVHRLCTVAQARTPKESHGSWCIVSSQDASRVLVANPRIAFSDVRLLRQFAQGLRAACLLQVPGMPLFSMESMCEGGMLPMAGTLHAGVLLDNVVTETTLQEAFVKCLPHCGVVLGEEAKENEQHCFAPMPVKVAPKRHIGEMLRLARSSDYVPQKADEEQLLSITAPAQKKKKKAL